jgi:8-oxo-dGTP pyrophosphatase MutT (NUDIX family)
MSSHRAAGIVIREGKVLLMHRINATGEEYYCFPGGGQEGDESIEQTVIRELGEEASIVVKPTRLLYHIRWDTGHENFFYLCESDSGEAKLRDDSEEIAEVKSGRQTYELMWVDIEKLSSFLVYQLEIRDLVIQDFAKGFSDPTKELFIKVDERRRK